MKIIIGHLFFSHETPVKKKVMRYVVAGMTDDLLFSFQGMDLESRIHKCSVSLWRAVTVQYSHTRHTCM